MPKPEVITVNYQKKEFLSILSKVYPTIASSKLVPLFQCFCFKDDKVASYNGHSGCITTCKLGGANFAVDAARLYKIVQVMPSDLELTYDGDKFQIKSGKNQTWLGTLSTRGFPDILPKDPIPYTTAANFVQGLKAVSFCVGNNPQKPYLLGVACDGDYLYSSDGNRIVRFKLSDPVSEPVTIPTGAVEHIAKLGQPSSLFTTGNNLGALWRESKTVYVTQTIAFQFPVKTVEQMLAGMRNKFAELPETLGEVVSRVKLLTPTEETSIILAQKRGVLRVSAATTEIGAAYEDIDWDYPNDFKLTVKPWYLTEGLQKTRIVDLTDVLEGEGRMLRFCSTRFDYLMGLMENE